MDRTVLSSLTSTFRPELRLRLSPPPSLKLDRAALLQEVRERLSRRLPGGNVEPDPTDPGWLILEESAWIAETLSLRLDAWPFAALRQLLHLMGGQLRPAHPSLTVLVTQPGHSGTMMLPPDRPSPWRFFAGQTEVRDLVEFCPVEPSVSLRAAHIENLCLWKNGELWKLGGPTEEGIAALTASPSAPERAAVFDRERIEFTGVSTTPEDTFKRLEAAVKEIHARKVDWLHLEPERDENRIRLIAWIEPDQALRNAIPDGLTPGGDVEFEWAPVDESTWVPPVRVADRPDIPSEWRGQQPMAGRSEGTLRIPNLPAKLSIEGLLTRVAAPMPGHAAEAIWKTVAAIDGDLSRLSVRASRSVDVPDGEPSWPVAALRGGSWNTLVQRDRTTFVQVRLEDTGNGRLRVALVLPPMSKPPQVRAYAIDAAGTLLASAQAVESAWSISLPDSGSPPRLELIHALDVNVPPDARGMVLAIEGEIRGIWLNSLLVANAPVVTDGRSVAVRSSVPEPVSLLHQDLVSPEVIEQLSGQPLSPGVRQLLKRLPLAHFSLESTGDRIKDYKGLAVDASLGELTLNAPDPSGDLRTIQPGDSVTVHWYRRTQGVVADVEAGAVAYVEHPPRVSPALVAVTNPVGAFYGQDRETEQQCMERLFTRGSAVPVLAADWEHAIRQHLGARAAGWTVRVWTHAERTLVPHALWPLPEADEDALDLEAQLQTAGPDCLLVALGPDQSVLADAELTWARHAISALVQQVRRRFPAIRDVIVTRFWPLTLRTEATVDELLPCFDGHLLPGLAEDPQGREVQLPGALLLNAAVVQVLPKRRPQGAAV